MRWTRGAATFRAEVPFGFGGNELQRPWISGLEAADRRRDCSLEIRGLTFELRRPLRIGAWAARRMMDHNVSRPKCQAVEGRLERRVRPHLAAERDD